MSLGSGVAQSAPGAFVSNGSIVTVHSGHARMTLFGGGRVEICGPAKFTLLQTSDAITVALNFGRVQVQLPANSVLRVFTPTIIGTPLDISGADRDIAVGLSLDDSLCVRATSGAIQLEHQFTGEKLIVPQAGEFFLNAGQLLPVAGTPGSCECAASDSTPIVVPAPNAPSQYAIVRPSVSDQTSAAPMPPALDVTPSAALLPPSPATIQKPEPDFDLQLLAHASEAHPVAPPKNIVPDQTAPPPPTPATSITVAAPLTFIASAPRPPLDPAPDVILLIRQAQVEPEWEFSGHVAAPEFALALQGALGQGGAQPSPPKEPKSAKPAQNKGGFWSAFKKVFGGS